MEKEPKGYIISQMSPHDLYVVLCDELSFYKMIELYKFIQHKMQYLEDKIYDNVGCQLDRDEK